MFLLFFAAVINYLDRSSLSVANLTIREELGLSATKSARCCPFSRWPTVSPSCPVALCWTAKVRASCSGWGCSSGRCFRRFRHGAQLYQFVLVRIGMGIGEAPMNPCGVKVINDWFNIKERGRPMGFFNAASTIGVAISPPILAAMMLMMGWRGMFITIGVLGIFLAIGWYMLYRNREHIDLTGVEQAYLNAGSVNVRRDPLSFAEWRSLFKNKPCGG
jgi:MFS family permease